MEFSKVINLKSKVWDYFTKNAQHQKAKCNKCGTTSNITGGNTKSFFTHLKNRNISVES